MSHRHERLTATREDIAHAAESSQRRHRSLPTETVYGLGANALDSTASRRSSPPKNALAWDPLIVHISDRAMLAR